MDCVMTFIFPRRKCRPLVNNDVLSLVSSGTMAGVILALGVQHGRATITSLKPCV